MRFEVRRRLADGRHNVMGHFDHFDEVAARGIGIIEIARYAKAEGAKPDEFEVVMIPASPPSGPGPG